MASNEPKIRALINNIPVEVPPDTSILAAAESVQCLIPTLCNHPDLAPSAACGICVVKVKGSAKMPRACCTPIEEGMEITTEDPDIVEVRRTVIEMILSNHPNECLTCGRNTICELQDAIANFGIREEPFMKLIGDFPKDESTGVLVIDPRKCIKCGRCVEVCQNVQHVYALAFLNRGLETRIAPAGVSLNESPCIKCGQCAVHCPTGAIIEEDDTAQVWAALRNSDKYCVTQIAPSIRVTIGEHFGYEAGANLAGQLYSTLRRMGFKAIFDTNFGADVTIVEEATEFVERLTKGKGVLPLITTCCPAWVDFMEKFHGDMVPHFSSVKSPHAIVGALSKTYYAEKNNIDPANMVMVSIMPCTAKKYEIHRSTEMRSSGFQDVDVAITTRELSRMIKQAGIDFRRVPPSTQDEILGEYTGAGTIFGATGGVMEAALRTAVHYLTGRRLEKVKFEEARGIKGIKEATLKVNGMDVRIAVAHGLANVESIIDNIRRAKAAGDEPAYHIVEVMACPGGCVGGGGQPYGVNNELRTKRGLGLYAEDDGLPIRSSHENPALIKLYESYIGEPMGERAHHLLHTTYRARPAYQR